MSDEAAAEFLIMRCTIIGRANRIEIGAWTRGLAIRSQLHLPKKNAALNDSAALQLGTLASINPPAQRS